MIQKPNKRVYVRVHKNLYHELFKIGGDRLIAYYILLKNSFGPEGEIKPFKTSNGRTVLDHNLISAKTGICAPTVLRHHRNLVKTGVVERSWSGTIRLLGKKEIEEKYGRAGYAGVRLGKDTIETAKNVFLQRLEENVAIQEKAIKIKKAAIEAKNTPPTYRDTKMLQALMHFKRFFKREIDSDETVDETIVMSLARISEIKNPYKISNSCGSYWKRRLKKTGDLKTRRRFISLQSMNWKDYKRHKKKGRLKKAFPGLNPRTLVYAGGYLCQELVSEFVLTSLEKVVAKVSNTVQQVQNKIEVLKEPVVETNPYKDVQEISSKDNYMLWLDYFLS